MAGVGNTLRNFAYRQLNDGCVLIDVPENAFLTEGTSESGWRCKRVLMGWTPLDTIKTSSRDAAVTLRS